MNIKNIDENFGIATRAVHGGFFRLSVGLEDTDDLIRDIEQALKTLR